MAWLMQRCRRRDRHHGWSCRFWCGVCDEFLKSLLHGAGTHSAGDVRINVGFDYTANAAGRLVQGFAGALLSKQIDFQSLCAIYPLRLPMPLCTRNRLLGSTRCLIVFNRDR